MWEDEDFIARLCVLADEEDDNAKGSSRVITNTLLKNISMCSLFQSVSNKEKSEVVIAHESRLGGVPHPAPF